MVHSGWCSVGGKEWVVQGGWYSGWYRVGCTDKVIQSAWYRVRGTEWVVHTTEWVVQRGTA